METQNKAIILGNGPSLSELDFEYLKSRKDIISFATNRIDLILKETDWYPDYYFCFSSNLTHKDWYTSVDKISSNTKTKCYVSLKYKKYVADRENVIFVKTHEHPRNSKIPSDLFSKTFTEKPLKSFSATVPAFQLCFEMGIKRIGIIGQDGYTYKRGLNHFDGSYGFEAGNFEKSNDRIIRLHDNIEKYCKDKQIKIFNLTKKSVIKNYKNIDIEHL